MLASFEEKCGNRTDKIEAIAKMVICDKFVYGSIIDTIV